jgi:hypothetical protein
MPEVYSRENNPLPGIDYSEIQISDDQNLGTGQFTTVLKPHAMAKHNPLISTIINVPVFQLMVNIDSETHEISVLLGRADNKPVLSKKIFRFSENPDLSKVYIFKVVFKNWTITGLQINGEQLHTVTR